jgi:hypothetical protein
MDQKFLEVIKPKLEESEFKQILDLQARNVVALGTDQVFALRDSDGEIRAFKQRVELSKEAGTLIQPVPNGPWVVSAQGYEVLSEAAGVCVIMPSEVLVDGVPKMNPFTLRDTQNGRVLAIYARAVAFRFSSKGIPQVCDWTSMFDLPSYRLIDLLAKAKDSPTAFRLLPIESGQPDGKDSAPGATWAKYPFDSSTSLWINTAHASALEWYKSIINREKKAIDFGQTFARRNATKHLLGIQKSPCSPGDKDPMWNITILCWRPTSGNLIKWDYTQYANVRKAIEGIVSSPGGMGKQNGIDLKKGADEGEEPNLLAVESADLEDAIDITPAAPEPVPVEDVKTESQGLATGPGWVKTSEVTTPSRVRKPKAKAPATGAVAPVQDLEKEAAGIAKNLEMAKAAFPDEYKLALIQIGVEEPLDTEESRQLLAALNRIIDKGLEGK